MSDVQVPSIEVGQRVETADGEAEVVYVAPESVVVVDDAGAPAIVATVDVVPLPPAPFVTAEWFLRIHRQSVHGLSQSQDKAESGDDADLRLAVVRMVVMSDDTVTAEVIYPTTEPAAE